MDLIHACFAGLDVHKKTVVACIRHTGPDGAVTTAVRTFGTMTAQLLALADWLDAEGVRQVAMESTGVYWKPIFNILEGRFAVILVNAHRLKQVPGRKTDVKDAEWIAQLLQYGLLSPSFIPPPEIRELRELTRQRIELVRDRAAVANRIQKVLEDANIKLGDVASDVLGVSGRAMIRAIIDGQDDPERLAELAKRSLRGKIPELKRSLAGRVTEHHRFLLGLLLDQVEALEGLIARSEARIDEAMKPLGEAAGRLRGIPGVGERAAEVILAEVGIYRGPRAARMAVGPPGGPKQNRANEPKAARMAVEVTGDWRRNCANEPIKGRSAPRISANEPILRRSPGVSRCGDGKNVRTNSIIHSLRRVYRITGSW